MECTFTGTPTALCWKGSPRDVAFDLQGMEDKLRNTDQPCFVVQDFRGRIGISNDGELTTENKGLRLLALVSALPPTQLGDNAFREAYNVQYAYHTGAMANGIASEDLVIAMGKAKLLGSFGAAGLVPSRIAQAIATIQAALPSEAYAFNLIHSPNEEALEEEAVKLYLKHGIHIVEASAYLKLTEHIVHYRVAGLSNDSGGQVVAQNKVIAKVSRKEVASQFMQPAPDQMLRALVEKGKITAHQAQLAAGVAMADDITVEADSGGHTDNRPLVALLPSILQLRDTLQDQFQYAQKIRVGAAGGISTPASALAAFMMGAAYVVTGSVNQSCIESGTSDDVRKMLAQAATTDVIMAPAADMFEMGVDVQVLKRGTLFGPRARKLYEYYRNYASIEDIPEEERHKLEQQVFQKPLETVWEDCIAFFRERDPKQIERAEGNAQRKMALIFRWYLGLSSHWANTGTAGRMQDYQIWCGPSMGAFNAWVEGTYLEPWQNRHVADVAEHIMHGAAWLYRIASLNMQGLVVPASWERYVPVQAGHDITAAVMP